MKKKILAGLICSMLSAGVGFAAPQVEVPKGDLHLDLTYTDTSNELSVDYGGHSYDAESFLKDAANYIFDADATGDFDGHITQTGLTYGLKDGYALYVGYGVGRTHTLNLYDGVEGRIGVSGKFDILDLQVQKKLDKNFAAFLGVKEFKSAIKAGISEGIAIPISGSVSLENDTKRMLELGVIGQAKLAPKADAFAKIGFGGDLVEYKAGINYKFSENAGFELGYNYLRVKDLRNSVADLARDAGFLEYDYDAKFTTKGFYYGLNYRF